MSVDRRKGAAWVLGFSAALMLMITLSFCNAKAVCLWQSATGLSSKGRSGDLLAEGIGGRLRIRFLDPCYRDELPPQ